jgi:endonuclease/exonuclease/phosphatase family metal-dependent hydrolase
MRRLRSHAIAGLIALAAWPGPPAGAALEPGTTPARISGGAASASLPIQIDGVFVDWLPSAVTVVDPAGDAGSSGIDFRTLSVANDGVSLFIHFDTTVEVQPDEGQDIRIVLDTDDDPMTGLAVDGLGAELVWSLGQRTGTLYLGGGSESASQSQIGLVIAPTVSGTEFEVAIRRDATSSSAIPLFGGTTMRMLLADFGTGGDVAGTGLAFAFDPSPQPVPSLTLDRNDPSRLRVASYNTENDGLFDSNGARQAAFGRMIGAIDADVWILNEVWNHNGADVEAKFGQWLPGTAWTAVTALEGTVVLSRFPVLETATLPVAVRDWVVARVDPRPLLDSDLLVIGNHLKAYSGASNDAARQNQVDGLVSDLARIRQGSLMQVASQTPIIAGGDMNLVGVRRQLETLTQGDIADEATWGSDSPPDWDGSEFDVVLARHPDARFVYSWRSDGGTYYPGKLDWLFYTGSVMTLDKSFVLETRTMTPANLALHGLLASDTPTASDHAPIVADFSANDVATVAHGLPTAFALLGGAPNPFVASTSIGFDLPRRSLVTIDVFDLAGRRVRALVSAPQPAGRRRVEWDGRDDAARVLPAGVYLVRMRTEGFSGTRRVVRMR